MRKIAALVVLNFSLLSIEAQNYVFYVPTHYHGIFSDQISSARSQGMGLTTITTEGVGTSGYNPATISPGNVRLNLAFNYAKGHVTLPKSYYPFVGISYKVIPKLTLGVTRFSWVDPDSYWTASIQGQEIDTDKKKQSMTSILAAYEILEGLHFGVSGNFLRDEAVEGTTTNKEFIANVGAIYDHAVTLMKNPRFTNQQMRFAASLTNAGMNAVTEQTYQNLKNFRDIPIILRLGTAYSFSIPAKVSFTKNKKFFAESPELLDLVVRLQYQNWMKHKDYIYNTGEDNSAFGIGFEGWFMKLLALRFGYYTESRSANKPNNINDIVVTEPRKSGITWGLGANIPVQRLTGGKVPFDIEVNLVTQKMMNEIIDKYSQRFDKDFRDKRFFLSVGLDLKWYGERRAVRRN